MHVCIRTKHTYLIRTLNPTCTHTFTCTQSVLTKNKHKLGLVIGSRGVIKCFSHAHIHSQYTQVMLTKNKHNLKLVNGSRGVIKGFEPRDERIAEIKRELSTMQQERSLGDSRKEDQLKMQQLRQKLADMLEMPVDKYPVVCMCVCVCVCAHMCMVRCVWFFLEEL